MTERLAEGGDADEAKAFNKIRARFLQEVSANMDTGRGIAGVVERPDDYFMMLMELSVAAARDGRQQPFPWFFRFCVKLIEEDDGTRKPPPDPVVN